MKVFSTKLQIFVVLSLVFFACPIILNAEKANKGRPISNAWELPPLILNDLDGQKHNLYDWNGKVIMLNFWATWCGPCQIEISDFIKYQRKFEGRGLQIIGVGLDDSRILRDYMRTLGIITPYYKLTQNYNTLY